MNLKNTLAIFSFTLILLSLSSLFSMEAPSYQQDEDLQERISGIAQSIVRTNHRLAAVWSEFVQSILVLNIDNNNESIPAILLLAFYGHTQALEKLLRSHSEFINVTDQQGNTIAHYAARGGSLATCQMLLRNHISFNISNSIGQTPLYNAIQAHHTNIINLLASNVLTTDNETLPDRQEDRRNTTDAFPLDMDCDSSDYTYLYPIFSEPAYNGIRFYINSCNYQ